MSENEWIAKIVNAPKKTLVRAYISGKKLPKCASVACYGNKKFRLLIGELRDIRHYIHQNQKKISHCNIEMTARNSAVPLKDLEHVNARIEPGAIIREHVQIADQAVIMMGAVINIGARIGEGSMIDMNAVIGGRAEVGKHCHVGAGAVLAGVIEPASAKPVILDDDVLIGANAVIVEGVHVGQGAIVGAGSVVLEDVLPNSVVAGNPARVIKQQKDQNTIDKTELVDELRQL